MKKYVLTILAWSLVAAGCADKVSEENRLIPCGDAFCESAELCCADAEGNPVCIDPKTNHDHCGVCDKNCGAGYCSDSVCLCGGNPSVDSRFCCPQGWRDRATAWDACGDCSVTCPTERDESKHFSPVGDPDRMCVAGVCQISCDPGYADLDHDPSNGCECGNGVREGAELCDRSDLGGATCESRGYKPGTLRCNDQCQFEFNDCDDGSGRSHVCSAGTYQCYGKKLQECKDGNWKDKELCCENAVCNETTGKCDCPPGMNCYCMLDFDLFPTLPDAFSVNNAYMNEATVQIAATAVTGTDAISGKSISIGPTAQDGRIQVADIRNGIGKINFDVRVVGESAKIVLLYWVGTEKMNQTDEKNITSADTHVEFVLNQDVTKFIIRAEGTFVLDNFIWSSKDQ